MKAENLKLIKELCSKRDSIQRRLDYMIDSKSSIEFRLWSKELGTEIIESSQISLPVKNYVKRQIIINCEKRILEIDKQLESL